MACACCNVAQIFLGSKSGLPELRFGLNDLYFGCAANGNGGLLWHAQVVVCHVVPANHKPKVEMPDARDVIRRSVELREATADETLAEGSYAMQHALDAVPHRSLDARWRVLINHGIWGCQLKSAQEKIRHRFYRSLHHPSL